MKKLITLLLAMAGMVGTVSADGFKDINEWVVVGPAAIVNGTTDWNTSITANKMTKKDENHFYLVVENCELSTDGDKNIYGFKICQFDSNNNWNYVYPGSKEGEEWGFRVSKNGTYTLIYTMDTSGDTPKLGIVAVESLTLSNNYGSNSTWNEDNESFHFNYSEGTKWVKEIDAKDVSAAWRFRIWSSGNLGWQSHNIAPSSEGKPLDFATNDYTSSENDAYSADDTMNSWEVAYSSSLDSYTISAEYDVVNLKWVVRADAYISKIVYAANDYATFGTTVPVDLSAVASSGVTAYALTADASTGKISKNAKSDVLSAGKGVLLENLTEADVTLSLPVSAKSAGTEANDMIAFTGGSSDKLSQTSEEGDNKYTHYILANEASSGVGFYKVNSAGNSMGANTAYLKVLSSSAAGARPFLWFDESTGINALKAVQQDGEAYNLAGQRVTQPTRGLYIVNGKKVIIK